MSPPALRSTLSRAPRLRRHASTHPAAAHYTSLRKRWAPRRRPDTDTAPPAPPRDLLSLLHGLGIAPAIRPYPGKTDLSHADPLAPAWIRRAQHQRGKTVRPRGAGLTRKGIAERYIRGFYYSDTSSEIGAVARVFTPRVLRKLDSWGCSAEDVAAWVWVLMSRDGRVAGLRLDSWARAEIARTSASAARARTAGEWKKRVEEWRRLEEEERWGWGFFKHRNPPESPAESPASTPPPADPLHPMARRIPPFLLLFILRLPRLHPSTIRLLIPYITSALSTALETKTPLLLLIRLLRHTRATYPLAIPHIAHLLTTHLHPASQRPSARLTALYNRLLTLFALPSHNHPFKSHPYNQRSQFLLLRKMASLGVPITREGYRALVTVQLAHAHTPEDRDRILSMAATWPPWPAPRDGHPLSVQRGTSRAATVLERMVEAGYAWTRWEEEARVLGGVDTDGSPTVQTRTWGVGGGVWAARVRATRTVGEAWGVFLEGLEAGAAGEEGVWVEMFEKVVARGRARARAERERVVLERIKARWERGEEVGGRLRRWDVVRRGQVEWGRRVVGGMAKEEVKVGYEVEVPGVEELFRMMKRVGRVKIGERLIAMLVRDAESLEAADWILKEWSKERWRRMIKGVPPPPHSPPPPPKLTNPGIAPVSSLENGQSQYRPFKARHSHARPAILTAYLHLLFTHTQPTPDFAVRLLLGHAPPYPPAWNTVMAGLAASLRSPRLDRDVKRRRAELVWCLYTDMTRIVEEDEDTLRVLCVVAERALGLSEDVEGTGAEVRGVQWDGVDPVLRVVSVFERVLEMGERGGERGGEGGVEKDPRELPLVIIPEPATLHVYIRILGFTGRNEKILDVLKWMKTHSADMDLDGVMFRRVITATRVFLGDDEAVVGRAREVVVEWLGVDGWPSDDDVEEYCILGGWRGG